jgi:PIN domain nuclease of toxin-antitoxin system
MSWAISTSPCPLLEAFEGEYCATCQLHHCDPFDRMLVAQAISEPLRLLTTDRALARSSELVTAV